MRFVATGFVVMLVGCSAAPSDPPAPTTGAAEPTTSTAPPTTTTIPPTATAGTPPTALEALGYPVSDDWIVETVVAGIDAGTGGLAVDEDGVIYHADFGYSPSTGHTLYRVLPDGTVEPFASDPDLMASLTMTTIGPDGAIFQSSFGSDRVLRIAGDRTIEVVAEGIEGPTGIVVRDDGTIFIEAFDRGDIRRIAPDGEVSDFASDDRFRGINGMTTGPDGTLYVVNFRDGGLFAVDVDGEVTELHRFPKTGAHVAHLDGSLFVTSRGGYVVWRYDLATGDVEIIAGNGEPGDADGRGAESSFGRPNAITVAPDGALYINHADGDGATPVTIRRIRYSPAS
jgi:sugar lactone lactonase YvrE